MTSMVMCPGLDEAVVGTHVNEFGTVVPVYDVNRVMKMFLRTNRTEDQAAEWCGNIIDNWDETIRPLFIGLDLKLAERIAKQRAKPN